MLVHKSGVKMVEALKQIGILSCCGKHFDITSPTMDKEYARLRIVGNDRDLHQLDIRLQSTQ